MPRNASALRMACGQSRSRSSGATTLQAEASRPAPKRSDICSRRGNPVCRFSKNSREHKGSQMRFLKNLKTLLGTTPPPQPPRRTFSVLCQVDKRSEVVTLQVSQNPQYLELVRDGVSQQIPKKRFQNAVPRQGESLVPITVGNRQVNIHHGELTAALNELGQ